MTPRLADMNQALAYCLRKEIQSAPPRQRLAVEQLTQIEAADHEEQMLTCETDAQREALTQRWLQTFNPSRGG